MQSLGIHLPPPSTPRGTNILPNPGEVAVCFFLVIYPPSFAEDPVPPSLLLVKYNYNMSPASSPDPLYHPPFKACCDLQIFPSRPLQIFCIQLKLPSSLSPFQQHSFTTTSKQHGTCREAAAARRRHHHHRPLCFSCWSGPGMHKSSSGRHIIIFT